MMVAVAPIADKRTKKAITMLRRIFSISTVPMKLATLLDSSTLVDESYTSVRRFEKAHNFIQSITVSDISETFNATR